MGGLVMCLGISAGLSAAILAAKGLGWVCWKFAGGWWPGIVAGALLGGAAGCGIGYTAGRLILKDAEGLAAFLAVFSSLPGLILGGFWAAGIELDAGVGE